MNDRFALLKFVIFAVVCIGFSAWLVGVIGNISLADRTGYEAEFADVQGLLVNDAVKVSGVTVGKVTGISVIPGGTALVEFELNDDVPIHEDAQLSVEWRDVFGLRFLYVEPGTEGDVEAGYRFPNAQTSAPVDLNVLLDRLVPVMNAFSPELQNQVLEALSEALVGNEQEVRDLLAEGASLTQAVASRDDELRALIENAATIMDSYAAREQQLRGLIDNFADVSETVAARNDALIGSIVDIADAQQELRRLLEANDGQLRGALDELEGVTRILAMNQENFEELITTGGKGLVSYHLISRIGQWFNIRAVGVSEDYQPVSTERGAELPPKTHTQDGEPRDGDASSGLRTFFSVPGGAR